uniref:Tectonic family member 2 n=1 Tax=Labrus bergylta TaxID=56723 RepID=A0A3Q3F247_9LABR
MLKLGGAVALSVGTWVGTRASLAEVPVWCKVWKLVLLLERCQNPHSDISPLMHVCAFLSLCGENDTETDCCPTPLCVLETLQVSACVGSKPQASLLIQARIHALLLPADAASDNNTVIPNQVYQPLGSCPCDLTFRACDVRCCCDKECSSEDLELFASHCLPGPFGGQMITDPDYQCSVQSSDNSPDWFPFLCMVLGRCVNNAPVAFLNNFAVECVTPLQSCPTGAPLQTLPEDLRIQVKNGQGGLFYLSQSFDMSGYQVGRPVIAGDKSHSAVFLRLTVSDGLCSTAEKKPVLFGENSTSGCLLPVSRQNLTECDLLRSNSCKVYFCTSLHYKVFSSFLLTEYSPGSCNRIPSHQHVQVWSLITGMVDGTPQRDILDLQVRCASLFQFQINFTEYDCNRNDVCWPELAFPITKFYTGEPYSQSLAKGLILVFFFITASILGTPWRQLRQAWS